MSVGLASSVAEAAPGDLRLVSRIELPGIRGRLDHLASAPDAQLLFVAGLGADTVQAIDLEASRATARLRASEPQGLAWSTALHRLYVANGEAGTVEAFEGDRRAAIARDLPDADNVRLDEDAGLLYVGSGRSLVALDLRTLSVMRRYALPGHPEAFEISGTRLYVNVPAAEAVVVLDRNAGTRVGTWSVAPAGGNFPMALDPSTQRLFVATRRPAGLVVFDTDTGRQVARIPICADADDLFQGQSRLYAVCGDGHVDVIRRSGGSQYRVEQHVATTAGARTGLLVPSLGRLFVAAPAGKRQPAALLVFNIE